LGCRAAKRAAALRKTIQGRTHGSFSPASKYGAPSLSVTVILLDGRAVNLRFPKTEPYRNNALVDIDVYEKNGPKAQSNTVSRAMQMPPKLENDDQSIQKTSG